MQARYFDLFPQTIFKDGSVVSAICDTKDESYSDLVLWNNQCEFLNVIDDMAGVNLDRLGVTLGVLREGVDDETYRLYLKVGIKRYSSRGDLASIEAIGRMLGASPLNIVENGNGLRLDGTWKLDGTKKLDGQSRPATFSYTKKESVYTQDETEHIGLLLDAARAAGIKVITEFCWTLNTSQMYDYTQAYSGKLDGTWKLDGTFRLDPTKKIYTPNYIALGDGAEPGGVLRKPQIGDTGLQNEIIRKPVTGKQEGNKLHFNITLGESELKNKNINELGLFRDSQVMLLESFKTHIKKEKETVYYCITQNI